MKKLLSAALVAASFVSASAFAAPITLTNSDFETGSLSGWTTLGNAVATASTTVTTFNAITYTITAAGNYMAQLNSGGSTVGAIEAALGIAAGTLNAYDANPNGGVLTSGAAMYQAFSGNAGDTLQFAWNYVATDYIPFNDPALALLIGPTNDFQVLASINGLGQVTGTAGNTGWQTYNATLGSSGAYKLAFVTFNDKDNVLNSYLHIDATAGGCTPNCPPPVGVPEPGSLPIVALGLAALAYVGRRRQA